MAKKITARNCVYYKKQDYASIWKRIFAWVIDLSVISFFIGGYWYGNFYFINDSMLAVTISFWGSVLIAYVYLAILKPSKLRTLGFRVADIKIVDLYGKKPSWSTMLVRFLLLAIGPFTLIIDILWLTGETTKQTLRDKYVGTYVVRNSSEPYGTGISRNVELDFLGWHLIYKEIVLPENQK